MAYYQAFIHFTLITILFFVIRTLFHFYVMLPSFFRYIQTRLLPSLHLPYPSLDCLGRGIFTTRVLFLRYGTANQRGRVNNTTSAQDKIIPLHALLKGLNILIRQRLWASSDPGVNPAWDGITSAHTKPLFSLVLHVLLVQVVKVRMIERILGGNTVLGVILQ